MLKLAIVDDNSFLIHAIKEKLSFFEDVSVKHTSLNGSELLTKLQENHNLDLILMDIEMPVLNGIETTQMVKQKYPHIKIIMLTADGYLLKEINPKDLYEGIFETLNGGAAMTPSIAMKTLKLLRNPIDIQNLRDKEQISLSAREVEVLDQLSKGLTYTVIAEHLFLSPSTVRKHIENIYKKLQVHSKIEAVQKARNHNII